MAINGYNNHGHPQLHRAPPPHSHSHHAHQELSDFYQPLRHPPTQPSKTLSTSCNQIGVSPRSGVCWHDDLTTELPQSVGGKQSQFGADRLKQQHQRLGPSLFRPKMPGSPSSSHRSSYLSSSLANLHETTARSPSVASYRWHQHSERAYLSTETLNRDDMMELATFGPTEPESAVPPPPIPPPRHSSKASSANAQDYVRHLMEQVSENDDSSNILNCVLIGDHDAGKTSLVTRYVLQDLPVGKQEPTVWDRYNVTLTIDGQPTELRITDTGGLAKFSPFRMVSYSRAHVFMLCFDITQAVSLRNMQERWLPELEFHNPNAAVILVGTKADQRLSKFAIDGSIIDTISADKIRRFTKEHKLPYVECSSFTGQGMKEAFDEAIWQVVKQRRKAEIKAAKNSAAGGGGRKNAIKREIKRALTRTTSADPQMTHRIQNNPPPVPRKPLVTPIREHQFQEEEIATTTTPSNAVDAGASANGSDGGQGKKPQRLFVKKLRSIFKRNGGPGDIHEEGDEGADVAGKMPSKPFSPKRLLKVSHSMNV